MRLEKKNYVASKNVAEKLGFIKQNDIEFVIENYNDEYHEKYLVILNLDNARKISEERMLVLSKKLNFAY